MLAVWRGWAFKKRMPFFKRQRAVSKGKCGSSPQGLKRHSQNKQPQVEASVGVKSVTNEGVTGDDLAEQKGPTHMGVWEKLVGRTNEERIFINGQPVTALLHTGSQVTHVSHDFCLANGIEINPLAKLVNIEGTGGDSIEYLGYAETTLYLPMGSHTFKIEALLLVLPTTDYLRRVPVSIGTTITDMVVDFIKENKPDHVSKSWKVVCCATQTRKLVQAQPKSKRSIKTTKPVMLPPSSITAVKGNTKFRSHGMRLNLIAESSNGTQLPSGVQSIPTYCTLEPGSSRVSVGLRNLSSRSITIPLQSVVGQLQQATIQKVQTSANQNKQGLTGKERAWVWDQLNLEGLDNWTEGQQRAAKELLIDSADVLFKDDLDLGKCNILKHDIKITDPQPFKERYRMIPPHLYEEVKAHLQEMVEVGAIRRSFSSWASAVVLVRKKNGGLRFYIDLCKLNNRTVKDGYSLPHIEDTLDCLHGAVWFSTLDLKSGYWQVVLEEEAKPLTAFTMGPHGFGNVNACPLDLPMPQQPFKG